MADTIITTPSSNDGGAAGWMFALVILAVVIGGMVLYQKGYFNQNKADTTNINVTIPDPVTNPPATNNGN